MIHFRISLSPEPAPPVKSGDPFNTMATRLPPSFRGRIFASRFSRNLTQHEGSAGFPPNHPEMTRFLGVPVTTGDGHVFGNLYLCDRVDGLSFNEEDEQLIEAFGRAAGLVIDQERLRSNTRELTLSEERERLARDLHDTVIQIGRAHV